MLNPARQIIKLSLLLAVLIIGIFSNPALAIEPEDLLEFDEAFSPAATVLDENTIGITYTIQPHHYMYRRFLEVKSGTADIRLEAPEVMPGVTKFDQLLEEEVETWHDKMVMTVAIAQRPAEATSLVLKLRSQGCLENELCYPPTSQKLVLQLPAIANGPTASPLNTASPLSNMLSRGNGFGSNKTAALPPEEAFVFEAIALSGDQLLLRLSPQPGYYLYKDKFNFKLKNTAGIEIVNINLPAGEIKNDPEFGRVEVYHQQVEVPVQLSRKQGPAMPLTIVAEFQGCRDGDICYPPMQREITFELPAASTDSTKFITANTKDPTAEENTPVAEQDRLASLLLAHPWKALLAFFGLGILLAFTPCVFPMIPILSGIIAGEGDKITTYRAFILSLVYVLAMALTYTVVGVVVGMGGSNLQAIFQNPWILTAFAGVFVLLSLSMFGFYELQLPASLQTRLSEISNKQEGGSLLGVAIMGFLSALIVGPCVAPPLMAALIVIGEAGNPILGGSALFFMGLGMGVPLIVIGTSAGKLLPRAGAWMDAVKAVFGIGLLGLAIWMLERILPGNIIMFLWGVLILSSGVYLGALEAAVSGWHKLWKSLGLILLIIGIFELIGAATGGDDWTDPLGHLGGHSSPATATNETVFRKIKTLADVQAAVAQASAQGKTVMLDFYADWCVECKRMEKNTFSDPAVQTALAGSILVQADVTAYDADDKALVKHFGLIGPPAILFFDQQGRELKNRRMIGYMNAQEFTAHIMATLK